MSVLNPNSDDEAQECPLCMEFLELDDINFYPCSCGYQICRFCWNKIRTEGSGLCPACRSPYSENPADFKPLTPEEVAKIKADKRQKDLAKKQKISENRKHLANVRVVQKNLVFVVGLSTRLADPEVLKKQEYFGRFGRIHKVVINTSTSYAGNQTQGPSASAYVTYFKSDDALRAIQAVNNIVADGRTLKASLGTTKYCSHFMKNMTCPKHDCMYLHELGDEAASFTKEEMQQGKHTEYEKNLHDELTMSTAAVANNISATSSSSALASEQNASTSSPGLDQQDPSSSSLVNGRLASEVVLNSNSTNNHDTNNSTTKSPSRTPSPRTNGTAASMWSNSSSSIPEQQQQQQQQQQPSSNNIPLHERKDEGHTITQQDVLIGKDMKQVEDDLIQQLSFVNFGNSHPPMPGQQAHQQQLEKAESGAINCDPYQSLVSHQNDLFEEDDLGFDPFHETQKALAEMLESESKEAVHHQQQRQQQQQIRQQQHPHDSSNHSHQSQPQQQQQPPQQPQSVIGGGLGRFGGSEVIPPFSNNSGGGSRVKQPPPGFDSLNLGNGGQQSQQRNLLSPDLSGPSPFEALASQLNLSMGLNSLNDPPSSRHEHHSGNGFHSGFMGNHGGGPHPGLSNGSILGGGHGLSKTPSDNSVMSARQQQQFAFEKQQQQQKSLQQQQNIQKDWQDGLRALLPNANVSFGALPVGSGMHNGGSDRMFSSTSPLLHDHHHEQRMAQRQQSRGGGGGGGGWNNMKSGGNDWTMLDPAIVSGQILNESHPGMPGQGASRSDSPSNWIKANLDQLTGDTTRFNGRGGSPVMLPPLGSLGSLTLSNLGIGGGQQQPQQPQQPSGNNGGWGQPPTGLMANTPPPGFAMNRGGMPPMQGGQAPHHPYAQMGGGPGGGPSNDPAHQLESELTRLVRS